ncbi:MAG: hypothetical protein H6622_10180 [Halobacteriovoraceae bacterium]|nr:hypothetical protein [Halobacteriovoraceae bacterium]
MSLENILLIIGGICTAYYALGVPFFCWIYLDKKYPKIKKSILYDTTGAKMYAFSKVHHRYQGYITIFLFNDQTKQKNRNRLSHFLEPSIDFKELVQIGKWEKTFGVLNIFFYVLWLGSVFVFYIVSGGPPFNYLYGIDVEISPLMRYKLGLACVGIIIGIGYLTYKLISRFKGSQKK